MFYEKTITDFWKMWPPSYFWLIDAEGEIVGCRRSAELYLDACIQRVLDTDWSSQHSLLPYGQRSGVKEALLITRDAGLMSYALRRLKSARHARLREQLLKVHAQRIEIILRQAQLYSLKKGPPVRVATCHLEGWGAKMTQVWKVSDLPREDLGRVLLRLKKHPAFNLCVFNGPGPPECGGSSALSRSSS